MGLKVQEIGNSIEYIDAEVTNLDKQIRKNSNLIADLTNAHNNLSSRHSSQDQRLEDEISFVKRWVGRAIPMPPTPFEVFDLCQSYEDKVSFIDSTIKIENEKHLCLWLFQLLGYIFTELLV